MATIGVQFPTLGCFPRLGAGAATKVCTGPVNHPQSRLPTGVGHRPWVRRRVSSSPLKGRTSGIAFAMEVPDFLPATWSKGPKPRIPGPSSELTAEEATLRQLEALSQNDEPYPDHGVEVMYRFAGFDPFERSQYFGPFFDLGQFERFRRIFHHATYRVLLGHKERRILSSLYMSEHTFKQRVWIGGSRPGEEEIYEFTLVQRVGGSWDGYWLTDSLRHDGQGITGGIAY
ncbi:hypothetical protein MPTK1_1g08280 [Marchantia polymorpha subsp. ruderalis]|uniref:Uncharacterized protein n=2 Tax=Marchantia polymorpha TaxID=3197 RepID=A0AAF6AMW2_MARPO|nr:hypothetical protein MARPO_0036s0071 [Marchantia polymorpha]BBM97782.1 hypothetical protein Mp_1g08280 [Marchantia polymorpha subsp. ruderalis]|eukprot:PTQ41085.1 hypothetical protein MARPO_0036s0071 [Marchantia polymorpha]